MLEIYGFIYIIENSINDKYYIGQTVNPSKRWSKHCSEKSHSRAIYSAIQKYGKENFEFILLENCKSLEELNRREKLWISYTDTVSPNGYNLIEGGGSSGRCSLETRQRISDSKKGRRWSLAERKSHFKHNFYSNKTHCPKGHSYNSENTYIRPNGHRMCRSCHRTRQRNRQFLLRTGKIERRVMSS